MRVSTDKAKDQASGSANQAHIARRTGRQAPPVLAGTTLAPHASLVALQAKMQPLDSLAALQRMIQGSSHGRDAISKDSKAIHEAAARGTSGMGGPVPFYERIQAAFGQHDISGVTAYTGASATTAAQSMGALGFTTGMKVAFADPPSLHTAAHEAAHTVQQRAGVHLSGGIGHEGDVYEQHADAVAARVVAGQSAEALLDEVAPPGRSPAPSAGTDDRAMPLQMKKGWESRRTEMLATLAKRDSKEAAVVTAVLARLPDKGEKICESLSLVGAKDLPKAKKDRDELRADHLLEVVTGMYKPDMSIADPEALSRHLNSPAGFGAFQELLLQKVMGDGTDGVAFFGGKETPGTTPREKATSYYELGADFTGTGACYQGSDVMDSMLSGMGVGRTTEHVFSKTESIKGMGRKDHKWTLLKDGKTIVDGTWKQFWKPIPKGSTDPKPTPGDWEILNSQPDVFVGTAAELRTRVESFNDLLSVPFTPEYIDTTLALYVPRSAGKGKKGK